MNWNELEKAISNVIRNNASDLFAPNKPGLTPYCLLYTSPSPRD